MTAAVAAKASARERLLASANELFYAEGVQTVGIDRIIEHAGVAKASLYNTFGSKDELIRAYLELRQASSVERTTRALQRYDTPRDRILGVFDAQAELFASPTFRGCAFAAASAEALPGSGAQRATENYRSWLRTLFTDLAGAAGVDNPAELGQQLHLLYDGAALSARVDRDPAVTSAVRNAAVLLVDAAIAARAPAADPAKAGRTPRKRARAAARR